MAHQKITLQAAAKVFGVHPRTIVRALSGDHNTYWSEDIDLDMYNVGEIAEAYDLTFNELNRVIDGREELLKPDDAAKVLGIQPRTFRDRVRAGKYRKIANGGIVRYLRSKIIEDKIANLEV